MYKRILIATDGSELADRAVIHGLLLAESVGATVILLTVTEVWSALLMSSDIERGNLEAVEAYEDAETRSAEMILEGAKERANSVGMDCEIRHVRDRKPAEGILETAELEDCDLIVMASHGRRGLGRMLLGSQTAEVLAYSKVPVLVLR